MVLSFLFTEVGDCALEEKVMCVGLKVGNYIFSCLLLQLVGLPALQMPFTGVSFNSFAELSIDFTF